MEVKKRRNLRKGVEEEEVIAETIEEEKEETAQKPIEIELEMSNAKQILFMFSFDNDKDVPYNLRKEEDDSANYVKRRAEEVLKAGINPEVQRPKDPNIKEAVTDTGFKMGSYTHCEGGITVFNQLLSKDWKVDDAHWKVKKSQQGIKSGKGKKRYQVVISLSQKGKEADLDDATCTGILRLLHRTYAVNAWDNRELPQNNIVLNFPLCRKVGTLPKHVFILQ